MAGPGDEITAAGRGRLRASHADREQVIGTLKAAFVQGRLTKGELDARAGRVFAARTYADLAALTADLPAGLTDAAPPRRTARPPMSTAAKAGIAGLCVAIAIAAPVALSFITSTVIPFFVFMPFCLMVLAIAVNEMSASRHAQRSRRGPLPPRPAQGGPAAEGEPGGPPGPPGGNRILCQDRRVAGAGHLRGRDVRRTRRPRSVRRDQRLPASLQVTA